MNMPNAPARSQLLDDLWQLQNRDRYISDEAISELARRYGLSKVEIEGVVSFYHFLHRRPAGKYTIYLNDSIISEFQGYEGVLSALEAATGARVGTTDSTGQFGLFTTSCIGMSDLEPAALINFQPFTQLTPQKAKAVIWQLRRGAGVESLADDIPAHIQHQPPPDRSVLLRPFTLGDSLKKMVNLTSEEALQEVERSGLRGMGGAFFPVGRKWRLCREQPARPKYVVCNADEGEPGTFKDRVLMQYYPGLMIEGMILAGYCTGAVYGVLYLRAEYRWMLPVIEAALEEYRAAGWLGKNLPTKEPFDFDIFVQLGAGAYVCGEETALLHSLEGQRGEPRVRTYFPVERGLFEKPTIVNNVESFAAAAAVLSYGADYFRSLGTTAMPGTRLLSVAGDCARPGIYEIEWGTRLGDLLDWCEAENPYAVQVSGPSGVLVRAADRDRRFDLDDLRCGGALTLYREDRDLLQVLRNYSAFFKRESCGVCTPCRAGNYIFHSKLTKLAKGLGAPQDVDEIHNWSRIMQQTSRCGLGRAATTALISAMEQFPDYFDCHFGLAEGCGKRPFDLESAVADYRQTVKS